MRLNRNYGDGSYGTKSNWLNDKKFEEESTLFLIKQGVLFDIGTQEVVTDKDRQVQGMDLLCDIPTKDGLEMGMAVDVKAIASRLPTFSFEVSGNIHSGQVGWFIKDDLLTDYYLIVYHDIVNGQGYAKNKYLLTLENVNYTKCLLIKKETLQQYVLDYFELDSIDDLKDVVEDIRKMSDGCQNTLYFTHDDMGTSMISKEDTRNQKTWFTVSGKIYETPINVIIREGVLESLATKVIELDEAGQPLYSKPDLNTEFQKEKLYREFEGAMSSSHYLN